MAPVLASFPLVVITAPQAGSQPRSDRYPFELRTPVDHTIQPAHQVAFPGAQYIYSVVFSPDGRTAYCQVNGTGIDLWAAGLSQWPGILAGCLAGILLVYLLIARRVLRRHQVAGEPHCRRCNYSLISQAPHSVKDGADRVAPPDGTRCPECGVDLASKRPVRGRRTARRLWVPTAAFLACVGAYAWLFLTGAPRSASAPNAPQIWSRWVDDLAEKHQIDWLLRHGVPVTRIMTVDTSTGAITGCLRGARSAGGGGYGMKISSNGRYLAVAESFNRLSWVSVRTGWATSSVSGVVFQDGGPEEGFVLEVEGGESDPCVYYRALDQNAMKSRLVAWHPNTGEQRALVEEPAYLNTYSNGVKACHVRRYALIHRREGIATASAPDFSQAYHEQKYVVTVRSPVSDSNAPGEIERQITIPGGQDPCSSPLVVSPDGSRLFVENYRGIVGYNANTGEELEAFRPERAETGLVEGLISSPSGKRLFLPVHPDAILVRDVERRPWVARLPVPSPFIAPKLWASADDRWLAAAPFRSTGNPKGRYITELFLYDLAPLTGTKE